MSPRVCRRQAAGPTKSWLERALPMVAVLTEGQLPVRQAPMSAQVSVKSR